MSTPSGSGRRNDGNGEGSHYDKSPFILLGRLNDDLEENNSDTSSSGYESSNHDDKGSN